MSQSPRLSEAHGLGERDACQPTSAAGDVNGRRLAEGPTQRWGAGDHWSDVSIGGSSVARSGGLCFVRMKVDGRWMHDSRKVVALP